VSGDELWQLARSFWLATASLGSVGAGVGGCGVTRPWRCEGARPGVLREHRRVLHAVHPYARHDTGGGGERIMVQKGHIWVALCGMPGIVVT
jgi:hypothetical protein